MQVYREENYWYCQRGTRADGIFKFQAAKTLPGCTKACSLSQLCPARPRYFALNKQNTDQKSNRTKLNLFPRPRPAAALVLTGHQQCLVFQIHLAIKVWSIIRDFTQSSIATRLYLSQCTQYTRTAHGNWGFQDSAGFASRPALFGSVANLTKLDHKRTESISIWVFECLSQRFGSITKVGLPSPWRCSMRSGLVTSVLVWLIIGSNNVSTLQSITGRIAAIVRGAAVLLFCRGGAVGIFNYHSKSVPWLVNWMEDKEVTRPMDSDQ